MHLGHVCGKLGIGSRADLARVLGSPSDQAATAHGTSGE